LTMTYWIYKIDMTSGIVTIVLSVCFPLVFFCQRKIFVKK
jgi:hypothetical protein